MNTLCNPVPFLVALFAISCAGVVSAEDTAALDSEAAQMDTVALNHGEANVTQKIASDFIDFAGSEENAKALVIGLRNGDEVHLETEQQKVDENGNPVQETVITEFTPATGHLGYGNVFISLALAEQQLKELGITDPTPEQIEAALNGGTITVERVNDDGTTTPEDVVIDGILALRADGMGWGEIAKTLEVKNLGAVISGIKSGKGRMTDSDDPDAVDSSVAAVDKHEYMEKGGKPDHKSEHGGPPEHAGRPDKAERMERVERPDKPEKVARPDRPERPEKAMKPEKPDRPGKG